MMVSGTRFLAENEHVERIVIFGERLRYEAVVRGIEDRGVKNTIHADHSTGFVELILNVRVQRDFDDGVEFVGDLTARAEIVPGMGHRSLLTGFDMPDDCITTIHAQEPEPAGMFAGEVI
jgi:hypothetical protein